MNFVKLELINLTYCIIFILTKYNKFIILNSNYIHLDFNLQS